MRKVIMTYLGKDSWGRHTYQSDNGSYWKFVDLKSKELCEQLDRLHSSNGFDGEPDCHIREDIEIIYK